MASLLTSKRACSLGHSGDPLSDAGILEHVLGFAGPGAWLYLGAVSNLWKQCYEKTTLDQARKESLTRRFGGVLVHEVPRETAYSAMFQSVAMLTWAYTSGLRIDASRHPNLQFAAGRHASLLTLEVAHELGMPMTATVFAGAVASGREALVDHLYTIHHCPMAYDIGFSPAKKGNISMLKYLKARGLELQPCLAMRAAPAGHLDTMKYLHSEGCTWLHDSCVVGWAAQSGNLEMVS
jgi:hypothetical protein